MRKIARMLFVVVGLLAIAASTAQASRGIRLSSSGPITATGRLTMNGSTICTVSLTLTAATTLSKTRGITQGTVTAGSITACSSPIGVNSGVVLTPISIEYDSFTGLLPNISGINIIASNAGFRLDAFGGGVRCLYGGRMTGITFNITGGRVTGVTFASNTLPLVAGSGLCPAGGTVAGPLTVTPASSAPTVTLV